MANTRMRKHAILGPVLGAMRAKEIDPKDPSYISGALLGGVGGAVGGGLAGIAGTAGGALAGATLSIPLGVALKNPDLLNHMATSGAVLGGLGGLVGGTVYGSRKLVDEVLPGGKELRKKEGSMRRSAIPASLALKRSR